MFTLNHFIWMGICAVLCIGFMIFLQKTKPGLEKVLSVCCGVGVISELIKTFSMMQMVPSADGTRMYLYIEMSHMPLHLCSLQIITIFYARFARESKFKTALLAFMYPSCVLGAFFALLLPSIFSTSISIDQAFIHPLAYQFFLYHSMLIVLGLYILTSGKVDIQPRHYGTSLLFLAVLAFVSIYLNSMFAVPVYNSQDLASVEYSPNFFFTYRTPIGIKLTEMWHWYVYLAIIAALAVVLVALFYIPVFVRAKKEKKTIGFAA